MQSPNYEPGFLCGRFLFAFNRPPLKKPPHFGYRLCPRTRLFSWYILVLYPTISSSRVVSLFSIGNPSRETSFFFFSSILFLFLWQIIKHFGYSRYAVVSLSYSLLPLAFVLVGARRSAIRGWLSSPVPTHRRSSLSRHQRHPNQKRLSE